MTEQRGQITAWSASRFKDYETCPQKAFYKHVEKRKEPGNQAMQRGLIIHKLAEEYARASKKAITPPELRHFKEEFKTLQENDTMVEQKWALTADWKPTTFFAKDAWLRIVLDCAYSPDNNTLIIIDHKTGKQYPDHTDTMGLYALGGFSHYPEFDVVRTQLWYLDIGEFLTTDFYKRDEEALQKTWLKKTKAMLSDTTFAPRPGQYCRYCHFRKENGGPCEF